MKKYLKTIAIAAAVIVVGFFWLLQFSGKGKKITLENNYQTDDILSDGQAENKIEEVVPESQNSLEKSKEETKKETAPNALPEKTNNTSADKLAIIDKLMSSGFQTASGRTIDTIIIHSSYDALGSDPFDVSGLIKEYKSYGVSPHYLIDRQGSIYRLVEEKNIAYHAGASQTPDGRSAVNNFSIGIELMNTKEGSFTGKQYDSLDDLLKYIKGRYKIKYVLGHKQIAPGRKDDPWNFDWKKID